MLAPTNPHRDTVRRSGLRTRGASQGSGVGMQEARFKAALAALSDPAKTTVILVTRPDKVLSQ